MGLFSRNPNAKPFRIDIPTLVIVSILVIVLIQAFGILFNLSGIKLGPVFQIVLIAATVIIAFAIAKKQIQGGEISRKDFFALVIMVIVTILAMIYMKDLIPSIFREGIIQLQSFLPIN